MNQSVTGNVVLPGVLRNNPESTSTIMRQAQSGYISGSVRKSI